MRLPAESLPKANSQCLCVRTLTNIRVVEEGLKALHILPFPHRMIIGYASWCAVPKPDILEQSGNVFFLIGEPQILSYLGHMQGYSAGKSDSEA